jgi:hypothetical protein
VPGQHSERIDGVDENSCTVCLVQFALLKARPAGLTGPRRRDARATVETWVSDPAGDPLLVVMAKPAASLAGELRRLIPELRAVIGHERRVQAGFDREPNATHHG